jgi:hypothetical protein
MNYHYCDYRYYVYYTEIEWHKCLLSGALGVEIRQLRHCHTVKPGQLHDYHVQHEAGQV